MANNNVKDTEKKITIAKSIISTHFYENDIKGSCLAQSYILYKYMLKLNLAPTLVKGYIMDDIEKIYYGHFWVECNNILYDVATDTYLMYYDKNDHNDIKKHRRLSKQNKTEYKCLDMPFFEILRNMSYTKCLEGKFIDDMKEKSSFPPEIYSKIVDLYNTLLK
jgi:hypothetical protein